MSILKKNGIDRTYVISLPNDIKRLLPLSNRLLELGITYIKSDAILGITQELNPLPILPLRPFAKLATYAVPQFLRDLIYDGVADNRYSIMGKRDECRLDVDGEFDDRFVDDRLAEA